LGVLWAVKIGDIVTVKVYGESGRYCIVGFYTDASTGERVAILARLVPGGLIEAWVKDLALAGPRNLLLALAAHKMSYTH